MLLDSEDAQSLVDNLLQGGSMADLGNQMIQLPASGEASPSAYETDSRGDCGCGCIANFTTPVEAMTQQEG
ncbi:hypothetical protein LINGRAHAP2_LOCUS28345, partial [Linum grandiflorum]